MATQVNLDALIPREDFEVDDSPIDFTRTQTITIRNLEADDFFYPTLRKPDFQRETADWEALKIKEFVESFLNGDLIPAIILWNSKSHIFVIDGAHRLSALIAWMRDDYGDGPISQAFFEQRIPHEQINIAQNTRALIKRTLGDYASYRYVITHPDNASPIVLERARRLGTLAIQVQWVNGEAAKAEESFFKINQSAVAINATELNLLRARHQPAAMAARAIIHAGTGHKYWSSFIDTNRLQVESLAKETYGTLFTPTLKTPIKTLDLPVAGHGYSPQTLQLVYDLVNLITDDSSPSEDKTGEETIKILKNTRTIVNRITGMHPSSLGLHPAVYFYGANGRYQPTAFLGVIQLILDWQKRKDYFITFTDNREKFEQFILRHKNFANQVATTIGSGTRGMKRLHDIWQAVLDGIIQGWDEKTILDSLRKETRFQFLKADETEGESYGRDYNSDTKSIIFLRDALKSAIKCKICGGLIHFNAMSIDHIIRKQDGGLATPENGELTHPFCNTTYKN